MRKPGVWALAVILGLSGAALVVPATAADAASTATLSVAPVDSTALRAGESLHLQGRLTDESGDGLGAGTVSVLVNRTAITSRTALTSWFSNATTGVQTTTEVQTTSTTAIAPGGEQTIDLVIPASQLKFRAAGVYPLSVAISVGGTTIVTSRTIVTWKVDNANPTKIALFAPLTVPATTGTFIPSETLEEYTATDGPLTRELTDLIDTPIAIGIDPRVIASIRVLGKSAPASAKAWLQQLESASNDTFPLQWADADLTVGLQAGRSITVEPKPLDFAIDATQFAAVPDAPSDGSTATPDPAPTTNSDAPPLPTSDDLVAWNYTLPELSWPTANSVTAADLPKLAASGITGAILDSTNVTRSESATLPGAASSIGALKVGVSDAALSSLIADAVDATSESDWSAAIVRVTAALAQISVTTGSSAPHMLANIGRDWSDEGPYLQRTLSAVFSSEWVQPSRLTDTLSSEVVTSKLVSKAESSSRVAVVKELLVAEQREIKFSGIAESPEKLTSTRRLDLLALLSNAWFDDPAGWTTATSTFLKDSVKIRTAVQVVRSSTVIIPNSTGQLPITISNRLDQPVTVFVMVRPTTTQLTVDPKYRRVEVTIAAESQAKTQVAIESPSNGTVMVDVALYSAGGRKVGRTAPIDINIQAGWETVLTLVFGALVIAIFAGGIYRNVRNVRRRRRAAAAIDTGEPVPASSAEPESSAPTEQRSE